MSPIDSILGIPGLVVQQVNRAQDIHVWARPKRRPSCLYCQAPNLRIKATYQRTLKHTRQGTTAPSATGIFVIGLPVLVRVDAPPKPTGSRCSKPMKAV